MFREASPCLAQNARLQWYTADSAGVIPAG